MKKVYAETFPAGQIVASVNSVTLANNTLKSTDYTVPTDTEWEVQSIRVNNPDDVARTVGITLKDSSGNNILVLESTSVAASGTVQVPNNVVDKSKSTAFTKFSLGAGMVINVVWAAGGASSGGTDADGVVILYRKKVMT